MSDLLGRVPRIHPEVGVERAGGRLLAAGPGDEFHTFEDEQGEVSEVAERVIELCDGKRTVAQIVDALCAEYEVERGVCEADTVAFVRQLLDKQVLVLS